MDAVVEWRRRRRAISVCTPCAAPCPSGARIARALPECAASSAVQPGASGASMPGAPMPTSSNRTTRAASPSPRRAAPLGPAAAVQVGRAGGGPLCPTRREHVTRADSFSVLMRSTLMHCANRDCVLVAAATYRLPREHVVRAYAWPRLRARRLHAYIRRIISRSALRVARRYLEGIGRISGIRRSISEQLAYSPS